MRSHAAEQQHKDSVVHACVLASGHQVYGINVDICLGTIWQRLCSARLLHETGTVCLHPIEACALTRLLDAGRSCNSRAADLHYPKDKPAVVVHARTSCAHLWSAAEQLHPKWHSSCGCLAPASALAPAPQACCQSCKSPPAVRRWYALALALVHTELPGHSCIAVLMTGCSEVVLKCHACPVMALVRHPISCCLQQIMPLHSQQLQGVMAAIGQSISSPHSHGAFASAKGAPVGLVIGILLANW